MCIVHTTTVTYSNVKEGLLNLLANTSHNINIYFILRIVHVLMTYTYLTIRRCIIVLVMMCGDVEVNPVSGRQLNYQDVRPMC